MVAIPNCEGAATDRTTIRVPFTKQSYMDPKAFTLSCKIKVLGFGAESEGRRKIGFYEH